MGVGDAAHLVNVIDFGLAKKYRDPRTLNHIPYKRTDVHGVGTSRFAAINTHFGIGKYLLPVTLSLHININNNTTESSRRDDLESLAYMLIYFLRGTLPWRKIRAPQTPHIRTTAASDGDAPASDKENYNLYNPVSATWDMIRDAKMAAEPLLTLGLPPEFDILYRYARGLEFDDLPDYEGLRRLFRSLAERVGIEYDEAYDWTVSGNNQRNFVNRRVSEGGGRKMRKGRVCEACISRQG